MPGRSSHCSALGCRANVSVDGGLDAALARAGGEGGGTHRRPPFHRPEHLYGWKTLLPCLKDETAVIG
jgi:hypothetical protein